ncbi:MAG: hypothetical protein HQL37_14125 [Alphaproteobacteria bacterium]|nr:hypothetical protein [Alphaproteobacteria bacterium]
MTTTLMTNVTQQVREWEAFETRTEARIWSILAVVIAIAAVSSQLRTIIGL